MISTLPMFSRVTASLKLLLWFIGGNNYGLLKTITDSINNCYYYGSIITMVHYTTGWWLSHPSEKYEFVSGDDDIPNWMGK